MALDLGAQTSIPPFKSLWTSYYVTWFIHHLDIFILTLQQPTFPSYRNQSVDLQSKSLTGFYMKGTLAVKG